MLDTDNNDGLSITYTGADNNRPGCSGQTTLIVQITCDSNTDYGSVKVDESNTCTPVINFTSKVGCKSGQLSALWDWFNSNKWVMFVTFLIVGMIVCFLGRTLFKPVLFIAGVIIAVGLVMLIFYSTFLNSNTKVWVGWVVLIGAILFGLIIGCIFVKIVKIGAFAVSAWGGFTLALLIYNAFLYKMNSDVGFWCFTVGVALVFGVLALFFFDHILIHATALSGSFLVINGIGLVAGRYQNPFTIASEIQNGIITSIDPVFYAYLAGNIILYLMGAMF